jgi:hypothetical protein
VPPRTNFFQDVVALVHRAMSGDALVQESGMVRSRATGMKREVDVLITDRVAGVTVTLAVEASKSGRRASQQWVEQLVQKHEDMGTSKLVLASDSGFTAGATKLAEHHGAVTMTPQRLQNELTADRTLFPKIVTLTAVGCDVRLIRADGVYVLLQNAPRNLDLVEEDGVFVAPLSTLCEAVLQAYSANPPVSDPLGAGYVKKYKEDDCIISFDATTLKIGEAPASVFVPFQEAGRVARLDRLVALTIRTKYSINAHELPLTTQLFGPATVEYGQFSPQGAGPAIFVRTRIGDKDTAVVRWRDGPGDAPRDVSLTRPANRDAS